MLDFVYYPVSAVLWFWHRAFGFVLGPDNGFAWALAVIFLVFTLRALLIKPFIGQIRSQLVMKKLKPQLEAVRRKHSGDRARQAAETRKLQQEHGFNPLMGCLPLLAQAPVFVGLLHVLRSFNRTGTGFGHLGMTAQENANTPNYVFGAADVQSFLDARLFGAPISAAVNSSRDVLEAFGPFGGVPSVWSIAFVAVPLTIVAAIATHLNSRASIARQDATAAANPQTAIMNKLTLWLFPAGVLVGGSFLPVAVLLYFMSNNIWTYVQQHVVYRRIDREPVGVPEVTSTVTAPKPGAKPRRR